LMKDEVRDVEDMVNTEGRDLERKIIRLEARLDSFSRRLSFMDGIGAPSMTPAPSFLMPGDGDLTPPALEME